MKSLDQEFVESEFANRGCKLLELYKNKNTPMLFQCRCGSTSKITYGSFKRGSYCLSCSGKKKHTLNEIKVEFANRGCVLYSDNYVNALTKMDAKCKCGRLYKISWNNLQQGKFCKICGIEKQSKSVKGENHYNWIKDRNDAKLRRTISARCRAHLQRALKRIGSKKEEKTYDLLGYNSVELKEHITKHDNWNNVKDTKWHLDHVFPVKAFNDYCIRDIKLINCLENLQPVEGKQNLRKNGKYNRHEFESWLRKHGHEV
jgi:hypothetical protein